MEGGGCRVWKDGWRAVDGECGKMDGGWESKSVELWMEGVELWRAVDGECGKMDGERVLSCGVRWM